MKAFRTLLVLLLVLGGIAAGIWWTRPPEEPDAGIAPSVLGGRRLLDAARIVIQSDPALPKIELERGGDGGMRLVEPLRDYASVAKLENLARVYDDAHKRPAFGADEVTPERLAETELEPGLGMIRLEWPGGEVVELRFGGRGVFGDAMFVLADGEIWSVPTALRTTLAGNVADYRDRFVFRNTRSQTERLELRRRRDDGSVEVIDLRRSGMAFELVGREDLTLNQGVVADVIDQVLSLRVDRFVEGRRRPGPIEPQLVALVEGTFGREQVDLYVGESQQMFGWVTPRELEFFADPRQFRAVFEFPLQTLRSNWLFPYEILDDLAAITIAPSEGAALALERLGRDLRLEAPIKGEANPTPVSELLAALRGFHVVDFVEDDAEDLRRYGLDRGYLVLRLRGGVGRPPFELHVGGRDGERTFVRRSDSPHVVAVSSEVAEVLRRPWIEYVGLRITQVENPGIVRSIVCAEGERRVEHGRGDDGYWTDARVEDAFDVVRDLVAKRVLGRPADLGEPLRIALELGGGRGPLHTLLVHRRPDGSVLVGVEGRDRVVYEVARRDGRALLDIAP